MTESLLGRVGSKVETVWGIASKGGLMIVGTAVLFVGTAEILRSCLTETVVLEPVIVKGPVGDGGPTVEMATQQIATYVDTIQRTGAREWRPPSFSDTDQALSIQIPGSSLTLDSVVREIVEFLPHRRRNVKVSITANPSGTGYVAAVSVTGGQTAKHKTCPQTQEPDALNKMFECIAVEAMKIIDPLFAASYLLSVEAQRCAEFKVDHTPANPVDNMKRRLVDLRAHCGFPLTRAAAATIIYRGRPEDQVWVPYIYGKLHLARAGALAKLDPEAQWYEYERAIRRFRESHKRNPPASVQAILWDVYIQNGVAMQKSATSLDRATQGDLVTYRLRKAEKILKEAREEFDPEVGARTAEPPSSVGRSRSDRSAALASHMRGLILYQQWMVETRPRYDGQEFGFAEGDRETKLLTDAHLLFDQSSRQARQPFEFYIEWGNTLRALRRFDDAVAHYRHAGDIGATSGVPLLNIAVALLEAAKREPTTRNKFDALQHTSSYLTWGSDGGPFIVAPTLPGRIADVLSDSGDESLAEDFSFCRWILSHHEAEPAVQDMSHTAALKYCVDQARDSLARVVVEEAAQLRFVEQENAPLLHLEKQPIGDRPVRNLVVGEATGTAVSVAKAK